MAKASLAISSLDYLVFSTLTNLSGGNSDISDPVLYAGWFEFFGISPRGA